MAETRLAAISEEQVERLKLAAAILEKVQVNEASGIPEHAAIGLRSIVTAYDEGITEEEGKAIERRIPSGHASLPKSDARWKAIKRKLRSAFNQEARSDG